MQSRWRVPRHKRTAEPEGSATKSRRVLAALLRLGWTIKRQTGSHKVLEHPDRGVFVFAFHDNDEIGPQMLARIAKLTGLTPEQL